MPTVEEVGVHLKATDSMSPKLREAAGSADTATAALRRVGGADVNAGLRRTELSVSAVTRELRQMSTASLTAATSVSNGIGRAAFYTAGGLTAMAGAATYFGLKASAGFEQSRIAFGTLTGSVESGNALFAQLQQFNLQTPFELKDIASATQTLLQFNVAGGNVMPTLKGISDVAALTSAPSENLQRIAVAIGQINQAGVLRAQDLNQLVQAGFPAYQLLTQLTGQTTAELRRQMDSGLDLPADKFIAALTERTGALARYADGAQAQAKTLAGQFSNLRDTINTQLSAATQPLADALKADMPQLQASIAGLITTVMPPLTTLFTDILAGAPEMLAALGPPLADVFTQLDRIATSGSGEGFANLLGSMVELVPGSVALLGDLLPVLDGIAGVLGNIARLPGGAELLVGIFAVGKLAPAIKLVDSLTASTRALAVAEVEAQVAGGGGFFAGGRASKLLRTGAGVAAGGALIAGGVTGQESVVSDLSTIGGGALTGATIGSIVPGVGTGVGAAAGALIGGGIVGYRRLTTPDSSSNAGAYNSQITFAPGAVVVNNPASSVDVQQAVLAALDEQARQAGRRQ